MNSELISLFGTPVAKSNIGREFTKEELQFFNTDIPMCSDKYLNEVQHTNQSNDYYIFDTFVKELKDIKTFCEQELKRYLEGIDGVDTDKINLNITASWLNKLKPQDHHPIHNHRNSHLSGILYIRCLPNDNIQFTNMSNWLTSRLMLPIKKHTPFNIEGASLDIKEGDFIIFPSLLLHQVSVNRTVDKERLSISFDTWPTYIPSVYPPYK